MGNNASTSSSSSPHNDSNTAAPRALRSLLRHSNNSLGLSKAELDARCRPSGLYPSCHWEEKAIRRLIADGKLAARQRGHEQRTSNQQHECPICFLQYDAVNVTSCCQAVLCTECYLQVKPQREKISVCPFCNTSKLQVSIKPPLTEQEIQERLREEELLEQARLRSRQAAADTNKSSTQATIDQLQAADQSEAQATALAATGFGSSLARNERVAMMRARSESMSSSHSITNVANNEAGSHNNNNANNNANNANNTAVPYKSINAVDQELVSAVAMPAEERRALEREMQAQMSHPLSRRLQAEEAERRFHHEREYYQQRRARMNMELEQQQQHPYTRGGGGGRGGGEHPSSSLLRPPSTGSAPRRDWNRIVDAFESGNHGSNVNSLDDLVVLEAAIMLSQQEEEERRRTTTIGAPTFDAARHASRGFPLAVSRVRRSEHLWSRPDHTTTTNNNSTTTNWSSDAAAMIMRGMSEEEQLAMAIAASLEEEQGRVGSSINSRQQQQQQRNHSENERASTNTSEDNDHDTDNDAPDALAMISKEMGPAVVHSSERATTAESTSGTNATTRVATTTDHENASPRPPREATSDDRTRNQNRTMEPTITAAATSHATSSTLRDSRGKWSSSYTPPTRLVVEISETDDRIRAEKTTAAAHSNTHRS